MNICVDDGIVGDSANSFLYQRINATVGQTVPATPMPRSRDWIDGLACP